MSLATVADELVLEGQDPLGVSITTVSQISGCGKPFCSVISVTRCECVSYFVEDGLRDLLVTAKFEEVFREIDGIPAEVAVTPRRFRLADLAFPVVKPIVCKQTTSLIEVVQISLT